MHSKDLAALIEFHRRRAGLTQIGVAEHAGVSRYVVHDLDTGRGRTIWKKLLAVLEVLNVRLEPEGPLVAEWRASRGSDRR